MKAEDLQFNDFVLDTKEDNQISRVVGFDYDIYGEMSEVLIRRGRDLIYRKEDDLAPVLINEEFIKNNGMEWSKYSQLYELRKRYNEYYTFSIDAFPFKGKYRFNIAFERKDHTDSCCVVTGYVHEFQHAVRICRCKEFANFLNV